MGKSFLADIPGNLFNRPLGTAASVASNGASGVLHAFRAPANLKVKGVYRIPAANEATHGTASTSASYRRTSLVNGGSAGSGTTVLASLNQTASQAALTTRAFTLASNPTVSKGDILLLQQDTVGGADNDGTVQAAAYHELDYELI